MSFLVDTDTCSAYMKGDDYVWQRFTQYRARSRYRQSQIGELFTWALRPNAPPQRLQSLLDLLNNITVLDVTKTVGRKSGEVRAALFDIGKPSPEMDLLIAPRRSSTI